MPKKPPKSPVTTTFARVATAVALGALVAVVLALLRTTSAVDRLELPLIDVRTRFVAGDREPDPRIVIVQITDVDVDNVLRATGESWPWVLGFNQAIAGVIQEAGAKALVVDLFHLDRGAGPDDFKLDAKRPLSPGATQRLEGEAEEAAEYGRTLGSGDRTVLAFKLDPRPTYDIALRREVGLKRLGASGLEASPRLFARPGANWPVRRIAEGAKLLGFANTDPDADGIVRRAVVLGRVGDDVAMGLPLAGLSVATGTSPEFRSGALMAAGQPRPIAPDGSFFVDFRRNGGGAYARVEPWRILGWAQDRDADPAKKLPPAAIAALKDKVVIFGVNLDGVADLVPSPVARNYEGPEFQATVLDDLWNGGGRLRARPIVDWTLLFAASILAALAGTVLRGKWLPTWARSSPRRVSSPSRGSRFERARSSTSRRRSRASSSAGAARSRVALRPRAATRSGSRARSGASSPPRSSKPSSAIPRCSTSADDAAASRSSSATCRASRRSPRN